VSTTDRLRAPCQGRLTEIPPGRGTSQAPRKNCYGGVYPSRNSRCTVAHLPTQKRPAEGVLQAGRNV